MLKDPVALNEMAARYARGEGGVTKDASASLQSITAAAESGHGPSQLTLATMYATGTGVAADPGQAVRWFRAAIASGQKSAEVPYATMLAMGNGVTKDDAAALEIFQRAAERGDSGAQWSMGLFNDEGRGGLTADPHEAVRWWKLAAEQGQPFAQARLGVSYLRGKGTRTNLIEAYAWLAASDVDDTKVYVKEMEKQMPARLLDKAKKLADERRALRKQTVVVPAAVPPPSPRP